MKSFYRIVGAVSLVIAVDGLSKLKVERTLEMYDPIPLVGQYLQLRLGYNTGIAFGLFANGGIWPLVFTGVIIIGLLVGLVSLMGSSEFPLRANLPVGLLLGGAIANFIDRIPDGRVTDFLDVGIGITRWPTFNLADSFIVLGSVIIIMMTMNEERQLEREI